MSEKKFKLLKDIVIPNGTVFTERHGHIQLVNNNYETLFDLTKDSFGQILYGIDESDEKIKEWFEEIL